MGANGDFSSPKVDSLEKALVCAMRTISLASEGPSARATELKPLPPVLTADPACPVTPGIGESDHRTERYDGSAMTRTLSAVYEDGLLCPSEPLPLREHQRISITVSDTPTDPANAWLDHDYMAAINALDEPVPSLEEVRRVLAKISGNLSDSIRAERDARG